jgi:hypothetical protein
MEHPKALQELSPLQALGRVWYYASVPLWVSFAVSTASLLASGKWGGILVAAVSGQMALTLIKLFVYTAGLMLALATALRGVWLLPRVLRWSGERLGGVAFDYSSAVIGVLLGILPAALFLKGCAALGATICVVALMGSAQALILAFCYAAHEKLDPHIREAPWLLRVSGIAFTGLFVWAFFHESWPEVASEQSQVISETPRER